MDPLLRYLKPIPKPQPVLWIMTVLLFVFSGWGSSTIYKEYTRNQKEKSRLVFLQQLASPVHAYEPTQSEREEATQWRKLRSELEFSWYPIFSSLEHTANPDIALIEFLPNKSVSGLTLRGNARNMEALVAYLVSLEKEPAFRNVYLAHQKIVRQSGLNTLEFEVRIKLR